MTSFHAPRAHAPGGRARFVALLLGCVIASMLSAAPRLGPWGHPFGSRWVLEPRLLWSEVYPLAAGQPVPPPPAPLHPYLSRFHTLLSGYLALRADGRMSFMEWVELQGITDPRTIEALWLLHEWYARWHAH